MSANNEKIICECGAEIKRSGISRHIKTKKHQKWVEERKKESEAQTRTLDLPENFWKMLEDRLKGNMSYNSYNKNLRILKEEWEDTLKFNGVKVTWDQVYDMVEAYRRKFAEEMAKEKFSKRKDEELSLPENFWQMVEDRFESDLSFNSYTKNLDILKEEWHDTREFNGVEVTEDQLYDMEEAWRREFKEQMAEERKRGIVGADEED